MPLADANPGPDFELGINPDKVCHVIVLARTFDAKEGLADPDSGSNPTDDGGRDILEDIAGDPTVETLTEFIRSLDEEEQIALVALAWVGRSTYDAADWDDAVAEARNARNERTAEYLLGIPKLGDYLEEGLAAFGEDCTGFEFGTL